jgi:hypothetical protein
MLSCTHSSNELIKYLMLTKNLCDELDGLFKYLFFEQFDMCPKQLHGGLHDPFVLHILNRLNSGLQQNVKSVQLILIQSARLIAHQ